MDVMAAHDIKVTFCLEPYRDDRGKVFAEDVRYLVREYGEKRGFDALLLLRNADGKEGPLFKGFACILPEDSTDCHGVTRPISDYTTDAQWRAQTDEVREALRGRVRPRDPPGRLAATCRARSRAGFDGIAHLRQLHRARPTTPATRRAPPPPASCSRSTSIPAST